MLGRPKGVETMSLISIMNGVGLYKSTDNVFSTLIYCRILFTKHADFAAKGRHMLQLRVKLIILSACHIELPFLLSG